MKKYFIFAAAAIVAASCAKTPAPVQTPDGPEAPAVEGQVAVQFGTNVSANVETKAVGSVDAWASTQKLYVYGFPRVKNADVITWDFENPFIKNVEASAPANGTTGKIEVLDNTASSAKPFYYKGTTTYDFFGYYVDDAVDATPNPTLLDPDKDAFILPITIDGGQDIMLAKASAADAFAALTDEDKNEHWSASGIWAQDSDNLWKDVYAFSAYAARRKVHPILKFEHQLTQIQLYVQSGTNFATNPKLKIKSVEFQEVNTKADLCIAVQKGSTKVTGVTDEGTPASIFVTEATATSDPVNPTRKPLTELEVASEGSAAQKLGDCTMLFPAASYKVNMTLSQETFTGSGVFEDQDLPIELKIGEVLIPDTEGKKPGEEGYAETSTQQTQFEKGYKYDVYVTVYGLEKVDVTVVLSAWAEGGRINIDTDDKPEF